jgi:lactate 2-monooxygenase
MVQTNSDSAAAWQKEIYLKGFAGKRLDVSIDPIQLEQQAQKHMSPEAFAYIAGGAGLENTIHNNRSAFEKYKIIPRMLRDVSTRDTSIEFLGRRYATPLFLSPVGVLEMVHPEADIAVGKAAALLQVPYIFSNQASKPMEEVAAHMGEAPRWFQLYWSKSRELVASFVERAERCGCGAMVVTLDTTMLGWRTRDLDMAYLPFLEGKGIAQYTSDPVFQKLMDEPVSGEEKKNITLHSLAGLMQMTRNYPGHNFFNKLMSGRPQRAVQKFINIYSNPALTWNDLSFLRQHTKLPILLKGIMHPDDARLAVDNGVDGIIISNHGGRQVDGSVGTLEMLPAIVRAVGPNFPVLIDGGVRGGADVIKALALGAKAVCIGRPYVYGLAIAGQAGVYQVVRNLLADMELTMGLAGCRSVTGINADTLMAHEGILNKSNS